MKSNLFRFSFLYIFSLVYLFSGCAQSNLNENPAELKKIIEEFKKKDVKDFGKKDLTKILKFLEKFTKDNPDNQEGHYFLGYIYDRMGLPDGSKFYDTYVKYEIKASDEFRKVIEINPDYKGEYYILSPYSKISSLWATIAVKYLVEGKTDLAKWAFKKGKELGGFSAEVLEHNRALMSCCKKNAILFTNGDMDTFPLWYLQLVENYRRDITIVNTSLLNADWYSIQLKNHYMFGDNNIKINISGEKIKSLTPVMWEPKLVSIPVPENILLEYDVKDSTMLTTDTMSWLMPNTLEYGNNKGIRIQDILVKEIIESNNWDRDVNFVIGPDENYIGLYQYLRYSGLVYQLTPKKCKEYFIDFDKTATYTCFCTDYDASKIQPGIKWDVINGIAKSYDRDVRYIPDEYRYILMQYYNYLKMEDSALCDVVLRRMEEKLPVDVCVPAFFMYYNMKNFYATSEKTNDFEKIIPKIEKVILVKLNREEFLDRDYYTYKTLIQIYNDSKDYKKAIYALEKIKSAYPEDSIIIKQLNNFRTMEGK